VGIELNLKLYRLDQYQSLVENGSLLERDRRGVKVLRTVEGQIVKFFRNRNFWSSALFRPYAVRFVNNAKKLRRLGMTTVVPKDLYYCREEKCHLVFYEPIPGETLRDALAIADDLSALLDAFARYLAMLHAQGVLFRSVHFGNVIVDVEQKFGLIDIADLKTKRGPLTVKERVRNFRHMTRYVQDKQFIDRYGAERFVQCYVSASELSENAQSVFLSKLPQYAPFFINAARSEPG